MDRTLHPLEQAVARLSGMMAELESQAFQENGFSELSMRQMLYLETIVRLGHPSFGELAEALGITRPSVTAIVGRLAEKGFVCKVQDDDDRRSFHITLTEKGQQFSQVHARVHQHIARALVARLDQTETEQLIGLLCKIAGS